MILDLKTLMAANIVLMIFMAFTLLFYRNNYKIFDGFEFWLFSTVVLCLIYISFFFRKIAPGPYLIVISNSFIVFAFLLRLDGISSFILNHRISKSYYWLSIIVVPLLFYFFTVLNSPAMRSLIVSSAITIILIKITRIFFGNFKGRRPNLYLANGILHILYGGLIMGRAVLWLVVRLFHFGFEAALHELFFLVTMVFEVGFAVSFILMNNMRTEAELVSTADELKKSLTELEQAVLEVKTLKGMIPICMHCKKIRDDQGYWYKLEKYLAEHTEAEFSHGICDNCLKKMYPEDEDGDRSAEG